VPFPEDRSDPLPVASHPALKIFSGKPQEPIAASQFGCDLAIVRSVSAVNPRVRELRLHSFSNIRLERLASLVALAPAKICVHPCPSVV